MACVLLTACSWLLLSSKFGECGTAGAHPKNGVWQRFRVREQWQWGGGCRDGLEGQGYFAVLVAGWAGGSGMVWRLRDGSTRWLSEVSLPLTNVLASL